MNIILFALTGMGNHVIEGLQNCNQKILCVVTRKEHCDYKYYKLKNIEKLCAEKKIDVVRVDDEVNWYEKLNNYNDEGVLLLVATFHKKIRLDKISNIKKKINIHPSLLPKYRGPMPVYWAIREMEKYYGYSVHELNKELDKGNIYYRRQIKLFKMTHGEALFKIHTCIEKDIGRILMKVKNNNNVKINGNGNYRSRPEKRIDIMNECGNINGIYSCVRANLPFPGVEIDRYGKSFRVKKVKLGKRGGNENDIVHIRKGKKDLTLYLETKKEKREYGAFIRE